MNSWEKLKYISSYQIEPPKHPNNYKNRIRALKCCNKFKNVPASKNITNLTINLNLSNLKPEMQLVHCMSGYLRQGKTRNKTVMGI